MLITGKLDTPDAHLSTFCDMQGHIDLIIINFSNFRAHMGEVVSLLAIVCLHPGHRVIEEIALKCRALLQHHTLAHFIFIAPAAPFQRHRAHGRFLRHRQREPHAIRHLLRHHPHVIKGTKVVEALDVFSKDTWRKRTTDFRLEIKPDRRCLGASIALDDNIAHNDAGPDCSQRL